VGVDASSTYCYLLAVAEHRDEDTWVCIYWMLANKGSNLTTRLPTRRKDTELGKQQLGPKPLSWRHLSHPASSQRISQLSVSTSGGSYFSSAKTGAGNAQSETQGRGHTLSTKLTQARRVALEAVQLANDVKILINGSTMIF
jgi:hypothetical protein